MLLKMLQASLRLFQIGNVARRNPPGSQSWRLSLPKPLGAIAKHLKVPSRVDVLILIESFN
jgi:hypothetical protein